MDEGLLHGILGKVAIAKDQARKRVELVERVGHQEIEGIRITVRRTLDEFDRSHVWLGPDAG